MTQEKLVTKVWNYAHVLRDQPRPRIEGEQ